MAHSQLLQLLLGHRPGPLGSRFLSNLLGGAIGAKNATLEEESLLVGPAWHVALVLTYPLPLLPTDALCRAAAVSPPSTARQV
jgi:hypothetical protein